MTKQAFRTVLEDILAVGRGRLRDVDSRDTLGTWTSLADVQILVAIAQELGLAEDSDLLSYDTVGELMSGLEARGAFAAGPEAT
jgi:acyl carrier protein